MEVTTWDPTDNNFFSLLLPTKQGTYPFPFISDQKTLSQYTQLTRTHHTPPTRYVECCFSVKQTIKPMASKQKQTYSVCFCCRRRFKLGISEAPPQIRELYHNYSDESAIMTASHLQRFLIEVQGDENITENEAQSIIDGHKHLSIFHRRGLNLESFFKFLFSDNNPPLLASRGVILFFFTNFIDFFVFFVC